MCILYFILQCIMSLVIVCSILTQLSLNTYTEVTVCTRIFYRCVENRLTNFSYKICTFDSHRFEVYSKICKHSNTLLAHRYNLLNSYERILINLPILIYAMNVYLCVLYIVKDDRIFFISFPTYNNLQVEIEPHLLMQLIKFSISSSITPNQSFSQVNITVLLNILDL